LNWRFGCASTGSDCDSNSNSSFGFGGSFGYGFGYGYGFDFDLNCLGATGSGVSRLICDLCVGDSQLLRLLV
jgi:hypothetical protein